MTTKLDSQDIYEIRALPDDMLLQNIRSAEYVLCSPVEMFPKADLAHLELRWIEMCAEAAGRAIVHLI